MDSDDFEFLSEVTRRSCFINVDNFDDYLVDAGIKSYAKESDTHTDFTSVTSWSYPSALDTVVRALKEKYSYGAYQIEDMLVFYGLRKLWEIVHETNLPDIMSMMADVRKYAVVPELKEKILYSITGDIKRPLHIKKDTYAFSSTLSQKLDVSNANICVVALLLSLQDSPTVLNNFKSINELYLFNLRDNIYNSSEQFFKVLVRWLGSYSNYIYNVYCKEMLQVESNSRQLKEMYDILIFARDNNTFHYDIIDYKSIIVKHNGVKTVVIDDTKKEQIPEFETLEPVFEQQVETPIADKPITQKVVIEKSPEPKPVVVQEPLIIEKPIVIEKPEETDIKKVVKHLIKLIFNRLHLSKK